MKAKTPWIAAKASRGEDIEAHQRWCDQPIVNARTPVGGDGGKPMLKMYVPIDGGVTNCHTPKFSSQAKILIYK